MAQNNTFTKIFGNTKFTFPKVIDGVARDVIIISSSNQQIEIFAQDLFDFVAEIIRSRKITKISDMSTTQIMESLI